MKSVFFSLIIVLVCTIVAGCASTHSQVVEKGRSLKEARRFFVVRNLKDNHAIHESIVRALKARGLDAQSGPLTLLPDSAQVVLEYEDRWSWDFSNHMVYLRIDARDPQKVFPYVSSYYQKNVAFSTEVDPVVADVVGKLFTAVK